MACGLGVMSRNSARFLWKSTPQETKDARPELAAVWRIGQCLWIRDYAGVYTTAQGFEWGPEMADFVAAFLEIYRKRIFQLMLLTLCFLKQSCYNNAIQNGWSLDVTTKMLTVVKPKVKTNQKLDVAFLSGKGSYFNVEYTSASDSD
ncbi:hypothetical protein GUJ93_ZPchr0383g40537 [Zizania palustris]|uniref:CSN8/PSMD8/EIF3K domain-containing protein n=1 Tax=Zizania palustris TaxID=103762 RepID=A0A8J5R321_ZIZPA|nr:hypothetical protein GUJ93_ZPchr0383g40537 [Zizania palustris]